MLNKIAKDHGFCDLIKHNDFKAPKVVKPDGKHVRYVTASCKHCKKFKLHFTYSLDENGSPSMITFDRPLHGNRHNEGEVHPRLSDY